MEKRRNFMLNPPETITGTRIILKKADKTFKQAQISLAEVDASRAELYPWLGWASPSYGLEDAYEYLQGCDKEWKEGKGYNYMLCDLSGQFMGMISALNVNEDCKSLEIGYWISTRFAGRGFMKEAVRLIEKEFFALGINRIAIHTDVLNVRSANVPQKLGYRLEGILRQSSWSRAEDKFRDINVFAKLKDEYK